MPEQGEGSPFDFIAGAACLDFANTAFRFDGETLWEGLHGFADVAAWGGEARLLDAGEVERLRASARGRPAEADAAFARAVALREAVFRVFTALAMREPADAADLAALDATQRDAFAHRRLVGEGRTFRWTWAADDALDRVARRVAESAAELLTRGDLDRVRRCAGDDCTRLFLDTSRSSRRRWCDMSHCGNVAKVRRFRSRHRARVAPPSA